MCYEILALQNNPMDPKEAIINRIHHDVARHNELMKNAPNIQTLIIPPLAVANMQKVLGGISFEELLELLGYEEATVH